MTADSVSKPDPLSAAIVAGTVALIESNGPLDDQAELRQAHRSQPTQDRRFLERGRLLGNRLGLQAELSRWRQVGLLVVLMLAVLVAVSSLAAARSVVGEARSINAIAAFVTLLGLNLLTLVLWLAGVIWPGALTNLSLGKLALGLTARLPLERGPHGLSMLHTLYGLLRKQRLLPWAFGVISHTIWALAFCLILAVLAFGFAFHAYRLSWESTILSADFFQRFIHITGWLPSWLGFSVPDADAVRQAGNGGQQVWQQVASQSDWAWWLMGCVVTYGLLPRVILALWSFARWRAGTQRLKALDEADPYVRNVYARLQALDNGTVVDPERKHVQSSGRRQISVGDSVPHTVAVIGFELPPEIHWPLAEISKVIEDSGTCVFNLRIAGTTAEREEVIVALERFRPWSLLVVCHGSSSPDRGAARFLRDLMPLVQQCSLLLSPSVPQAGAAVDVDEAHVRRWRDWLAAEGLDAFTLNTMPVSQTAS